ncbi:MAG: sodium:proton exchanger [Actinobacteria bacterium]|nr:sodium:proton exchanger [Actinomycetota bacterium]
MVVLVALGTVPGLVVRFVADHPTPWVAAALFGIAIVAAAFALSWAAEVAQMDVSRGLALAALAFIAVLPEYAVDLVFAWKAGKNPDEFAHLALANMTGANRLLIGLGWSAVVFVAVLAYRRRRKVGDPTASMWAGEVQLDRTQSVELAFLALATAYSLTLPLKRTLTLFDAALLVGIFVAYLIRISGAPSEHPDLVGPAQLFGSLGKAKRRLSVLVLFVTSAGVILAVAEPFAENLVHTGKEFGVDEFLLVQWLAPLASEAPELIVAILFAWRLKAKAGLGALVSSKVNQWTLLVGTLPIVFALSSGSTHGLPIDGVQREEIFLTAAQSVFAVAVLMNLSLDVREALWLLGLFLTQFIIGAMFGDTVDMYTRIAVGCTYLVLAAWIAIRRREHVRPLARNGFRHDLSSLGGGPT